MKNSTVKYLNYTTSYLQKWTIDEAFGEAPELVRYDHLV